MLQQEVARRGAAVLHESDAQVVEDAEGNPITLRDEDGNPILDDDGNEIPAVKLTETATGTVGSILPQATATVELSQAPGIEEIVVAEGEFDGDFKEVQIANVHGAATGVIGQVSVRPFVRAITSNGDNVTTYGQVWTL